MATYGGSNIVTNGLSFNIDAANYKSYPSSGISWFDLSGNENTGTLINGPTYSSDNLGSIVFDGTDDYISTITNTAFGTGSFSIDMWFKPNGIQPNNSTPICIGATAVATNWQISFTSNTLAFLVGPGAVILATSSYVATNNWANFTVVRESTASNQSKFYINGVADVSFTIANNFSQVANYRIGMNRGSAAWYKGNISNTKVYNRALTASEVVQNYNAIKLRYNL